MKGSNASPEFLKTGTADEEFQQAGKQEGGIFLDLNRILAMSLLPHVRKQYIQIIMTNAILLCANNTFHFNVLSCFDTIDNAAVTSAKFSFVSGRQH